MMGLLLVSMATFFLFLMSSEREKLGRTAQAVRALILSLGLCKENKNSSSVSRHSQPLSSRRAQGSLW